jgi:hypothetical protein
MEERSMVAEGKIRSLQTENEALRLHLKLAVESLRNPIPTVRSARNSIAGSRKVSVAGLGHEEGDKENLDHENMDGEGQDQDHHDGQELYEDEAIGMHNERAHEIQGYMQELLKDLRMFKRKIGDDKSRFLAPLGERVNR